MLLRFVWSVSSGSLPHNLTLDSSTAIISGMPDTAQSASFTIQVKDANGQTAVQSYTLTINSTGLAQLLPVVAQVPGGTSRDSGRQCWSIQPVVVARGHTQLGS